MITLNLEYPERSDIAYKISKFPDGQQDVTILQQQYSINNEEPVTIRARFNGFKDLELIIAANKALVRLGYIVIHLYIPYLLGARSDRQFQQGGTSYLVDVVAPIINAQNFMSVSVMDPHSDVSAACINRMVTVSNLTFVGWALKQINNLHTAQETTAFISPDAGAMKKIQNVLDYVNYRADPIIASKKRGVDGKLSNTVVPVLTQHLHKDLVIIDDICDGGRTFLNIVSAAKAAGYVGKFYLIVTHGIFSAGIGALSGAFAGVYSTNSVQDLLPYTFNGFEYKQTDVFL